jgi:tRNA A37 methylthiotransferase MiaB
MCTTVMKILLLQPPVQDFYDTAIRLQPLGLCLLKAAVERHIRGAEVAVRDFHQGFGRRTVPIPPELAYLREYYAHPDRSPFSTFSHYYHFGATVEEVGRTVARERPDLVGISSLFSAYHGEALACAREIKKRLKVPIVMGGAHVSAVPESVLLDPHVDFVIRGEGERALVELVRAFQERGDMGSVASLGYKRGGERRLNPMAANYPLDELPPADLSDFATGRYLVEGRPLCSLVASRGCPHRCTFCSVRSTSGATYRRRPPEQVLAEMRQRYAEGYRVFNFEDDNLAYHRKGFKSLLEGCIAAFPEGGIRLLAMNGVSYLSLNRELLGLMKRAGFHHLDLSLVSTEEATLARMRRPHSLEKYLEVVKGAHAVGLPMVSYQILGLPGEPIEAMISTMALMARLPVTIGASIFYLTPGCALAAESSPFTPGDLLAARSTAMAGVNEHLSRDDLYTLFITARIINFLKRIPLPSGQATLKDALNGAGESGPRARIGAELIERLLGERRLYAATRNGRRLLSRFRPELFFRVCDEAGFLRTRQGAVIALGSFPSRPDPADPG